MPAAEADCFTEGSKAVRQGRFRNSSGELRHDGDNPLSRDKTHWPMVFKFFDQGPTRTRHYLATLTCDEKIKIRR